MNNQEVKRYFDKYVFGFIKEDILREINLARSGDSGGNFLAALGLLCYTEFMGKILLKGEGTSKKRFDAFFRLMGETYKQLIDVEKVNVYRIFRCGMAHTYFSENCVIKMLNNNYPTGIVIKRGGTHLFIVEKYFQDFMEACRQQYIDMTAELNPYLPST